MKGVFTPMAGWARRTNKGFYREHSSFGSSLSLNFINDNYSLGAIGSQKSTKSFSDIITFTRASGGGRFNAQGQYEWLPANQPRIDYDPVTGAPRGLLIEEQRTRLNTVSTGATLLTPTTATYVDDGTLFIDGTTPFRKLVEDTSNSIHHGVPAKVSLLANTTYTAQYVVKAAGRTKFRLEAESAALWATAAPKVTYNLIAVTAVGESGATGTIKAIGGGRFIVTFTATTGATPINSSIYPVLLNASGGASYAGDGVSGIYISGHQLEAGAFATSLIVGEGSQVTRSADVASVNTLSPWYNASEGTIVASFAEGLGFYPPVFTLDDGTGNNRFYIYRNAASATQSTLLSADGSAAGVSIFNSLSPTETGDGTLAFAYANNSFALAFKGGAVVTDTSGAVPTNTTLSIGNNTPTGRKLNGHIRILSYYPRRLSNTELQEITA